MRNLLPPDAADITFLPAGLSDVQPGLLNSATAALSTHSIGDTDVTVVVTPRVPGPYPVTSLLQSADAIFVLAVPRWTRLQRADGGCIWSASCQDELGHRRRAR